MSHLDETLLNSTALKAIRWYQSSGGSKKFFGIECNFTPTCSEYTYQAIERYGLINGVKIGAKRIASCNEPDCICIKDDPLK